MILKSPEKINRIHEFGIGGGIENVIGDANADKHVIGVWINNDAQADLPSERQKGAIRFRVSTRVHKDDCLSAPLPLVYPPHT